MIDELYDRHARTRENSHEISYTPIGESRTRLRFEPGETTRWALCEDVWDSSRGQWRPVGTTPVRNLQLDIGGEH